MRRMTTTAALTLAAAALLAGPADAAEPAPGKDCQEQQAFIDGDPAVVAARLPQKYKALTNPSSGRPLVFARGLRCAALTLGGRTAPGVMASYGVLIESPDGTGCGSAGPAGQVKGDEPPVCNWYVLRWLASDRRVVDWLRRGTPDFPVTHVPELVFDLGTFDQARNGTPVNFSAGGPSPYTIEAVARENPRELSVRGGYWAETSAGTVKIALSSDDLIAGDGDGTVRTARGTELADLMGAEERSYAPVFDGFASVKAGHGVYRKQVLPPSGSTAGFAGSCSVKGTVRFDPTPANNGTQPLSSDYTATGTCTGSLDGRELKDAPVSMYHGGRAEGGCRAAKTVSPWHGAMRFESGEVVRYTLDFTSTSTELSGTMYGERSGDAPGKASFLTDRTPPDVAQRCAGEGVRETPLDLRFSTRTPLVNEPAPEQLAMSVRPRTVRSGRATTFAFRVRGADGRPLPGAFVRFYGRRVRTGADGTARVTARLERVGAHAASAKAEGFRGARVSVRVAAAR